MCWVLMRVQMCDPAVVYAQEFACVVVTLVCTSNLFADCVVQSCCWVSLQRGTHLYNYIASALLMVNTLLPHKHAVYNYYNFTQCYCSTHHPAGSLYMCTVNISFMCPLELSKLWCTCLNVVVHLTLVVHAWVINYNINIIILIMISEYRYVSWSVKFLVASTCNIKYVWEVYIRYIGLRSEAPR